MLQFASIVTIMIMVTSVASNVLLTQSAELGSPWRRVEKLMENNLTRRKILGKQISHFFLWGWEKGTIDNNSSAIKNLHKIPNVDLFYELKVVKK